jgi:hypothetical protein
MTGRYDPIAAARVMCGDCRKQTHFLGLNGGGDTEARAAGWIVRHGPQPFVRCPSCKQPHEGLPQSAGKSPGRTK